MIKAENERISSHMVLKCESWRHKIKKLPIGFEGFTLSRFIATHFEDKLALKSDIYPQNLLERCVSVMHLGLSVCVYVCPDE